jgi:hypothetical protein
VCTEWLDKAQAVLDAAAEDGDDADADAAPGADDSMQE